MHFSQKHSEIPAAAHAFNCNCWICVCLVGALKRFSLVQQKFCVFRCIRRFVCLSILARIDFAIVNSLLISAYSHRNESLFLRTVKHTRNFRTHVQNERHTHTHEMLFYLFCVFVFNLFIYWVRFVSAEYTHSIRLEFAMTHLHHKTMATKNKTVVTNRDEKPNFLTVKRRARLSIPIVCTSCYLLLLLQLVVVEWDVVAVFVVRRWTVQ